MTRANTILERYEALVGGGSSSIGGGSSNIGEELENLTLTDAGTEAVSRVQGFLTDTIKGFNAMMKWDWPTLAPSLRQLNSDDLEWEVTVNSESNGDEFVGEFVTWAEETLIPAVDAEFESDEFSVTAELERKSFPQEDGEGDIDFATATVQLSGLKDAGFTTVKQTESLGKKASGADGLESESVGMVSDGMETVASTFSLDDTSNLDMNAIGNGFTGV